MFPPSTLITLVLGFSALFSAQIAAATQTHTVKRRVIPICSNVYHKSTQFRIFELFDKSDLRFHQPFEKLHEESTHHRHHRPGWLLPGRTPSRQGLRGPRPETARLLVQHGAGGPYLRRSPLLLPGPLLSPLCRPHRWRLSRQHPLPAARSEEHTSEIQPLMHLLCRVL